MSFFGAMEGLGTGLANEGSYQERMAMQRDLLAERQQGDLQRQRERLDDKSALALTLAGMKQDAAGAGGKGAPVNLFTLAQSADTPEKQDRLIETTRAFQGDDAANVLGRIFGKGKTRMADPAREDVTGYVDATGGADTAVPAAVPVQGSISSREADKGRQGLQRLMALVMDPAKLDPYSKGEAQLLRNDVTTNVTLPKALKDPTADTESVNDALTTLDPKAINQSGKNSAFADRTEVLADTEQGRRDRAAQGEDGRNYRSNLAQARSTYAIEQKAYADSSSKDRAAAYDRVKTAKERLDTLLANPPAAAAGEQTPTTPRSPRKAAAAYKAGQGY